MRKRLWCLLLVLMVACGLMTGALASGKQAEEETDPALEKALAETQQLVDRCWQGVVAEGTAINAPYLFTVALGQWLHDNADVKLSEDGDVAILVLPNLKKLSTQKLPQYKGEEPILYLGDLAAGIVEQIAAAAGGDKVEIAFPASGELPDTDSAYLDAMRTLAEEVGTTWVAKALKDTKAYGALSRLMLDDGQDAAFWKKISFADKNQVPAYAKNTGYKLLKKGSSGAAVKKAQQALEEQGYFEGKIDSSYGTATIEAVEKFQRASGLLVNGELSPEQQSLLYADPDPLYLSAILQGDVGDTYWATFLYTLRNINWDGGTFQYQAESFEHPDALYEVWLSEYLAANAPRTEMETVVQDLYIRGDYLPEDEAGDAAELPLYSMYIPLDVFLDRAVTAETILQHADVEQIRGLYAAFAANIDNTLAQAGEYADNNLEPIPLPKSGFLIEPEGGKSQISYANKGDTLLFVKVYQVSDAYDTSTGNLVATAFVQPKERAVIRLRPGYYHQHFAFGYTWYGEKHLFGEDEALYLSEEDLYSNYDGNTEIKKDYRLTTTVPSLGLEREQYVLYQLLYGVPMDEF